MAGIRAAHIQDRLPWSFLYGFSNPFWRRGAVDELKTAEKLYNSGLKKKKDKEFRGLSFDTISAAGSNGAIVHYRANKKIDKALTPCSLYLVDSGPV